MCGRATRHLRREGKGERKETSKRTSNPKRKTFACLIELLWWCVCFLPYPTLQATLSFHLLPSSFLFPFIPRRRASFFPRHIVAVHLPEAIHTQGSERRPPNHKPLHVVQRRTLVSQEGGEGTAAVQGKEGFPSKPKDVGFLVVRPFPYVAAIDPDDTAVVAEENAGAVYSLERVEPALPDNPNRPGGVVELGGLFFVGRGWVGGWVGGWRRRRRFACVAVVEVGGWVGCLPGRWAVLRLRGGRRRAGKEGRAPGWGGGGVGGGVSTLLACRVSCVVLSLLLLHTLKPPLSSRRQWVGMTHNPYS